MSLANGLTSFCRNRDPQTSHDRECRRQVAVSWFGVFVLTQIMGKRSRKRGRPRTGHDPMVGVRLPAIFLRKIDKMAAEIGADRSMIIRLMVEHVLGHGSPEVEVWRSLLITGLLGRKGRRGRVADRIASAVVENLENLKNLAKAYLAARRGAKTKARRDNIIEETPSRPRLPRT